MKKFIIISIIILTTIFLTSCNIVEDSKENLHIVTTTTMLNDIVKIIGGDVVISEGLCKEGVDPHSYKATAGDITKLNNADIVVYNGFNLEGKMGEVFSSLENQNKNIICIEDAIDESKLIFDEEYDPHIWFDVELWKEVAIFVAGELSNIDSENKTIYQDNLSKYLIELDELHIYIKDEISKISKEQRVLITAHDAFNYFGKAYEFEVIGIQGVNTQTQASMLNIIELSDYIVENKIKAIFIETSMPTKNIEVLQEAVKSKGFEVTIGGELYSDSLGDISSGNDSYIKTVKSNVDTIVTALK